MTSRLRAPQEEQPELGSGYGCEGWVAQAQGAGATRGLPVPVFPFEFFFIFILCVHSSTGSERPALTRFLSAALLSFTE